MQVTYAVPPPTPPPIKCSQHSRRTHTKEPARDIFFAKQAHERKERWVSGNFVYHRMERITDIYFVSRMHFLAALFSFLGEGQLEKKTACVWLAFSCML
jgi:hypothetical protein